MNDGPPRSPYDFPQAASQAVQPPGTPRGAGYNPYAPPVPAAQLQASAGEVAYGDAAGEHLRMKRGRYAAWMYVGLAFAGEAVLFGIVPGSLIATAARGAGAPRDATWLITGGAALALGLPLAYFVFRDRWRCTEAFSSRFCVGLANISVLFVPIIALVYANVRGVQKLGGR